MTPSYFKILIGLHRMVNDLDLKTARLAKDHGLTFSQFAVLEALYSKGPLSIGQVQEKILSSSGTIPLIVKNLKKQDFISIQIDPKDRRRKILTLSPKGQKVIKEVFPKNQAMLKEAMSLWTEEDQNRLASFLKEYDDHRKEKNHDS